MLINKNKYYREQSVFKPENLLREARRQKRIGNCLIPKVCILDPDGDIVRYLRKKRLLKQSKCWACYHTELYTFKYSGQEFGIVGCVVGASFAVLVAEELFVSGCRLLISITSAGSIMTSNSDKRFLIIGKALRDEGTSYHYLKPSSFSSINSNLLARIMKVLPDIKKGITWTTDGPFRETISKIRHAKSKGAIAVEMEASALYAFAEAKKKKVVCIAHITNQMGQTENDFEKGLENGSVESLDMIYKLTKILAG
ncbi:MAG: uridine phosphorylase [Candidatus Kerfeldbacteria bacterium RIFOXYA2_FULL_38_24]|nr:MAG: uridine phosphorylase [Candidatus Peregrinibacteria bacterium RIFOXYA12_FULL_33_12]OGY86459.1 MAG: uridine phosphorylase [Candidatus Kerfeldbacteria bacterium RIFOXYA2_FULL_38_24]